MDSHDEIKAEVIIPYDMFWVDVDPDTYNVEATESAFELELTQRLFKLGINASVTSGSVVGIRVECDKDITEIVQNIVNEIEVLYFPLDDE